MIELNHFREWCSEKEAQSYTENVMLVYFNEISRKYHSSTLWAQYSMMQSCLLLYDNTDISKYPKLLQFWNSVVYQAKTSKVLTRDQIETFLSTAEDNEYLMIKVAVIFGIAGALRLDELVKATLDDIEDVNSSLIVKVPNTKSKIPQNFAITFNEGNKFYRIISQVCRTSPFQCQP